MATFTRSDELQGAEFVDADIRGARFVRADLSGVVTRAVDVQGVDIDRWLYEGGSNLCVNGVDVIPLVEAELNRRFPGRADRRAGDPDGLRRAWATLERIWAATLEPTGVADPPALTHGEVMPMRWFAIAVPLRGCDEPTTPPPSPPAGTQSGSARALTPEP